MGLSSSKVAFPDEQPPLVVQAEAAAQALRSANLQDDGGCLETPGVSRDVDRTSKQMAILCHVVFLVSF